jgi:hypothetical protein
LLAPATTTKTTEKKITKTKFGKFDMAIICQIPNDFGRITQFNKTNFNAKQISKRIGVEKMGFTCPHTVLNRTGV